MSLSDSQQVFELANVDEVIAGIAYQLEYPQARKMDQRSLQFYLSMFLTKKQRRDHIREYVQDTTGKNLDFKVCHRLWELDKMIKYAQKEHLGGYPHIMPRDYFYVDTMKSIADAYISGKLQIHDAGIVTYWARGEQVTVPVTYNYEQLKELSQAYGRDLWTEGDTKPQSREEFETFWARFFPDNWEQVRPARST